MSIIVIDNYDSFTYNLIQYLGTLTTNLQVFRNNRITVKELARKKPDGIVISPGPGSPEDAGISENLIQELGPTIPTLGVCLGYQCMGTTYGADIQKAPQLIHGKTSRIIHDQTGIFEELPTPLNVARYHSLALDRETIPDDFEITAETRRGLPMGFRHTDYPMIGIQFHPESILTEQGMQIIKNFYIMLKSSH